MEGWQIRELGFILAEFVRALGMMADNMQRQALGESMSYTDEALETQAQQIEFHANNLS